jgi:4-diphosphocytidyl-2-C-methyl-D-erythritol kinase
VGGDRVTRSAGGSALTLRAFAKINLSLRIAGTRPDGYHELQTVYQSLALHDTVRLVWRRGSFRLDCDDPGCPMDRTNLVWRAVDAAWRAAGRRGAPNGLAIQLTKRIPMTAGLGGGSSDAAATLGAIARRWRLDHTTLASIARSLGADVPYFLCGGTALGIERGDVVFPLADAPRAWVVLVVPGFGVRTEEAYAWWDRQPTRGACADQVGTNDLQGPVIRHHPEVGRILSALRRARALAAALSGSGSSVYGLFARAADARAAAERLARPHRRVIVTRTISRSTYLNSNLRRRSSRLS